MKNRAAYKTETYSPLRKTAGARAGIRVPYLRSRTSRRAEAARRGQRYSSLPPSSVSAALRALRLARRAARRRSFSASASFLICSTDRSTIV